MSRDACFGDSPDPPDGVSSLPAQVAPSADALSALEAIDSVARERVLVFGSLPPNGRDIDLLVREADVTGIVSCLRDADFQRCRQKLALFRDCSVCVVELVEAGEWSLPAAEVDALFSEGAPLDGLDKVVEPAPHHVLLILARKLAGDRRLGSKQRARIDRAIDRSPAAWELAGRRAALWDAEAALAHLRRLYEASSDRRRKIVRRPSRTSIITLSGVDGAGKSSQAMFLQTALDRLGHDAVIEWSPAHAISLNFLANPIRRLLRYEGQSSLPDRINPEFRPSAYPAVVVHAWVTIAVLATALSLWRAVWAHLGRGRVVVCDRFTLDFATFFSYRHGIKHDLRFQRWLLRLVAPRPKASYFLDLAPEEALARKEDQYTLPELHRQAELYRSFASSFRVRTFDGQQPAGALAREIGLDIWRKLDRCAYE